MSKVRCKSIPKVVTDHAGLENLAYAASGHTGFAGTGIANVFDAGQEIVDAAIAQLRLSHNHPAVDYCDFTVDANGYLLIDSSGARVGIGGSPGHTLHVYGRIFGKQQADSATSGLTIANVSGGRNLNLWVDAADMPILDSGNSGDHEMTLNSGGGTVILAPGGYVQFGTHSAIGSETVTGYITILDGSGATRKLAVVS